MEIYYRNNNSKTPLRKKKPSAWSYLCYFGDVYEELPFDNPGNSMKSSQGHLLLQSKTFSLKVI